LTTVLGRDYLISITMTIGSFYQTNILNQLALIVAILFVIVRFPGPVGVLKKLKIEN
jgi:hypothetical protein